MIAAGLIALVGLVLAGLLGVASGEGPVGSTAARTVSVEGVGTVPIGISDNESQATAVYREGMAKALADAQAKAAFLGEKAGGSVGAAVSIVEDGGSIECTGGYEQEGSFAEARYSGEQPDFGWGHDPGAVGENSVQGAPAGVFAEKSVSHRPAPKRRKKRHTAKKAATSTASCNLTASVAVIYALG